MNSNKSESDEDRYIPSGLLNNVNQTIERKDINTNEIAEFYNAEKIRDDALDKQSSSSVIIDLSTKHSVLGNNAINIRTSIPEKQPSQSQISPKPTSPHEKSSPVLRGRILSIPPGPRSSPSVVRPSNRLPLQGTTLHHRPVHAQQMHPTMYRPVPVSLHPVIQMPVRPLFYSSRPHPYAHAGFVPMKMLPHPQVYTHYVQSARHSPQLPIQPIGMYPSYAAQAQAVRQSNVHHHINKSTMVNSTIANSTIAQSSIAAQSIAHSSAVLAPTMLASSFNPSTVVPTGPVFPPGMISVPYPMQSMPGNPNLQEVSSILKFGTPSESAGFNANELRKKLKIEAAAKAKEEKECRRAELKAKKEAKRADSKMKKKDLKKESDSHNKKMSNFAKDMFVIRLKDVDSFDRNNEIWRIDNHVLIQKFCGVPSLRAPARQFQSTNKMAGYDARAIWRFFIIDSEHVEIDKYGADITVHKFPSIAVLRDAKKVAEVKDEEFKSIEKGELKEKRNVFEAKQFTKTAEKQKRIIERKKKKKFGATEQWSQFKVSSSYSFNEENDDVVCRNIINGLLDALEDENYNEEDSFYTSEEELSFSDEDDAGSLITLAHSTDTEEELISLDEKEAAFELYGEHEVPEVAFELTVD